MSHSDDSNQSVSATSSGVASEFSDSPSFFVESSDGTLEQHFGVAMPCDYRDTGRSHQEGGKEYIIYVPKPASGESFAEPTNGKYKFFGGTRAFFGPRLVSLGDWCRSIFVATVVPEKYQLFRDADPIGVTATSWVANFLTSFVFWGSIASVVYPFGIVLGFSPFWPLTYVCCSISTGILATFNCAAYRSLLHIRQPDLKNHGFLSKCLYFWTNFITGSLLSFRKQAILAKDAAGIILYDPVPWKRSITALSFAIVIWMVYKLYLRFKRRKQEAKHKPSEVIFLTLEVVATLLCIPGLVGGAHLAKNLIHAITVSSRIRASCKTLYTSLEEDDIDLASTSPAVAGSSSTSGSTPNSRVGRAKRTLPPKARFPKIDAAKLVDVKSFCEGRKITPELPSEDKSGGTYTCNMCSRFFEVADGDTLQCPGCQAFDDDPPLTREELMNSPDLYMLCHAPEIFVLTAINAESPQAAITSLGVSKPHKKIMNHISAHGVGIVAAASISIVIVLCIVAVVIFKRTGRKNRSEAKGKTRTIRSFAPQGGHAIKAVYRKKGTSKYYTEYEGGGAFADALADKNEDPAEWERVRDFTDDAIFLEMWQRNNEGEYIEVYSDTTDYSYRSDEDPYDNSSQTDEDGDRFYQFDPDREFHDKREPIDMQIDNDELEEYVEEHYFGVGNMPESKKRPIGEKLVQFTQEKRDIENSSFTTGTLQKLMRRMKMFFSAQRLPIKVFDRVYEDRSGAMSLYPIIGWNEMKLVDENGIPCMWVWMGLDQKSALRFLQTTGNIQKPQPLSESKIPKTHFFQEMAPVGAVHDHHMPGALTIFPASSPSVQFTDPDAIHVTTALYTTEAKKVPAARAAVIENALLLTPAPGDPIPGLNAKLELLEKEVAILRVEDDKKKVGSEFIDQYKALKRECIHVGDCPLHLPCSVADCCNTACGGHHCTHFSTCTPKVITKEEAKRKTPAKTLNAKNPGKACSSCGKVLPRLRKNGLCDYCFKKQKKEEGTYFAPNKTDFMQNGPSLFIPVKGKAESRNMTNPAIPFKVEGIVPLYNVNNEFVATAFCVVDKICYNVHTTATWGELFARDDLFNNASIVVNGCTYKRDCSTIKLSAPTLFPDADFAYSKKPSFGSLKSYSISFAPLKLGQKLYYLYIDPSKLKDGPKHLSDFSANPVTVTKIVDSDHVEVDSDTALGNSGSPVFDRETNALVGMHLGEGSGKSNSVLTFVGHADWFINRHLN